MFFGGSWAAEVGDYKSIALIALITASDFLLKFNFSKFFYVIEAFAFFLGPSSLALLLPLLMDGLREGGVILLYKDSS